MFFLYLILFLLSTTVQLSISGLLLILLLVHSQRTLEKQKWIGIAIFWPLWLLLQVELLATWETSSVVNFLISLFKILLTNFNHYFASVCGYLLCLWSWVQPTDHRNILTLKHVWEIVTTNLCDQPTRTKTENAMFEFPHQPGMVEGSYMY